MSGGPFRGPAFWPGGVCGIRRRSAGLIAATAKPGTKRPHNLSSFRVCPSEWPFVSMNVFPQSQPEVLALEGQDRLLSFTAFRLTQVPDCQSLATENTAMSVTQSAPIPRSRAAATVDAARSGWIASNADAEVTAYIDFRPNHHTDRAHVSQLDRMAATAASVSLPRQALIGALLHGIVPRETAGSAPHSKLWAYQAMQRADSMITLIAELEHRVPFREQDWHRAGAEYRGAMELAAAQRSLDAVDDERLLTCSDVLNTTVCCMISLFGPAIGQVVPHLDIEPLALPALRRKALVLATWSLVIEALVHGFAGRGSGDISVSLHLEGPARACLHVSNDGRRMGNDRHPETCGAGFDLASVLGSVVNYSERKGGGTTAEIIFPVPDQTNTKFSHSRTER